MRRIAVISALLVLVALMSACGGGGDNTLSEDFSTGDLKGEWNFQSGDPLTDNGNLTFDSNGNLIGVTPPPGSSDVIVDFSGRLSVEDPGYVMGLLTINSLVAMEGGAEQTVTQELNFSGNFVKSSFISGVVVDLAVEDAESTVFSFTKE